MIKAGYHCLIAGLTDYQIDGDNKSLNISSIKEEITSAISKKEKGYLALMIASYDINNICMLLNGRDGKFNSLGNYSSEEVKVVVDKLKGIKLSEEEEEQNVIEVALFDFLKKSIAEIESLEVQKGNKDVDIEKIIITNYYQQLSKSKNSFLRIWGESDRTIKNICAAIEARRLKREIADVVIGEGFVVENLISSSAPDFGLKGEIDVVDSVLSITEQTNMLKKEKELDLLRWKIIDELNVFEYFGIDVLLSYYLKLCMINRWLMLDEAFGREMFAKIVEELSNKERLPIGKDMEE
ncbi:MAG: DUF2764 family protein [Bacteroidetes bacterium]|nr:DUF2764 family protein [Bacteroidota bacterium]